MKKTNKHTQMGIALGMSMGISIGMMLGSVVFDNISIGMCMGLGIGMCLGSALGAAKDEAINKQLEEQGYTIKEIIQNETEYTVLIVNKEGLETSVTVSKETMEEEQFSINDIVFLNEEGILEQAYDKEEE